MERMYRAVAQLSEGQQILEEGTFEECAKWCDDVIRANGGNITVWIAQIRDGRNDKK